MKKPELLAPAGNLSKLKTALYFGADAVYCGGKNFSLRTFSDNFSKEDFIEGVKYAHGLNKKVYVTINIFAKNSDFIELEDYLLFLQSIKVDGIIVSDPGIVALALKITPGLDVHLSTQANTLNKYSARFWADLGVKRVILARELSLNEIAEIRSYLPESVEIEAFCHGAMCISYSGRCLLSDYFTGRSSNRGACVQACRWKYSIREALSDGEFYDITEDSHGTYIMNSKDLNMISYIDEMVAAGICSFKIEGRMKSEYYVATVVNAYRRAIDAWFEIGAQYKEDRSFVNEILKTNHRAFTTAYCLGNNDQTVNYDDSQSAGERSFIAYVLDYDEETAFATVEMRNRFKVGDTLEVLSPSDNLNKTILVSELYDEDGNFVSDAKIVQQKLKFKTNVKLSVGDILRR